MSYRDNYDSLVQKNEALERENEELKVNMIAKWSKEARTVGRVIGVALLVGVILIGSIFGVPRFIEIYSGITDSVSVEENTTERLEVTGDSNSIEVEYYNNDARIAKLQTFSYNSDNRLIIYGRGERFESVGIRFNATEGMMSVYTNEGLFNCSGGENQELCQWGSARFNEWIRRFHSLGSREFIQRELEREASLPENSEQYIPPAR